MKFKKSQKNAKEAAAKTTPEALKAALPFSGDALTKLVRGFHQEDSATAVAKAVKELAGERGYKAFKGKAGQAELLLVMEGKKRFKGQATDPKSVLTTGFVKKAV